MTLSLLTMSITANKKVTVLKCTWDVLCSASLVAEKEYKVCPEGRIIISFKILSYMKLQADGNISASSS